jgi:hypothetical protein
MPSKQLFGVIMTAAFAIALTFTPLPENWRSPVVIIAWRVTAFAGGAWVNENRKTQKDLNPVDKREKLDRLVRRGQHLTGEWVAGKRPKLRTRLWFSQVDGFVRSNFSVTPYDQFNNYTPNAGAVYSLALEKPKTEFPDFDTVISTMGKTQA